MLKSYTLHMYCCSFQIGLFKVPLLVLHLLFSEGCGKGLKTSARSKLPKSQRVSRCLPSANICHPNASLSPVLTWSGLSKHSSNMVNCKMLIQYACIGSMCLVSICLVCEQVNTTEDLNFHVTCPTSIYTTEFRTTNILES